MGFAFYKMLEETGIAERDVYILARKPDTDSPMSFSSLEQKIEQHKPPLLVTIGEACKFWLPECRKRGSSDWYQQLGKNVGSLLLSDQLHYPHYMMPIWHLEKLMGDWGERNVTMSIDLGKIRCELEYWRAHGFLQPLPARTLVAEDLSTDQIEDYLWKFSREKAVSCDIETVYPRNKEHKYYHKHPGLPVVLAFAPSPSFSLSFSPWRETLGECERIWSATQLLFNTVPTIIGQNFFNFDALFINLLGIQVYKSRFQDTLIRHHILWPELSHKLQFMTRQYTRQPFYKDEGKHWSLKDLHGLRHYNALDAAVTFEVYEGQELEFSKKPALRGNAA
jgi:hypothetical protein